MSTYVAAQPALSQSPAGSRYFYSLLFHTGIIAAVALYAYVFRTIPNEEPIILFPYPPAAPADNGPGPVAQTQEPSVIPWENIAPKPQVIDTPTASPQAQDNRITADDFFKKHPRPDKPVAGPKPANTTQPPLGPIRAQQIKSPGSDSAVPHGANTFSDDSATSTIGSQMDNYFALLASQIREAQEKPEGLSSELVVRIEFQVFASGVIGEAKVITSSGNRAFDASVLQAIRSVRPIGRRPDGKSNSKTADFRMREEG